MLSSTQRGAREGFWFGIAAGIPFAVFEVLVAVSAGEPAIDPFRLFASVLLGRAAFATTESMAFIAGCVVHAGVSGGYGLLYGLSNTRLSVQTQTGVWRQMGLGFGYGVLLWLVNVQIIARVAYPWFLHTPQLPQVFLHGIFFGIPLALMYSGAERRSHDARASLRM